MKKIKDMTNFELKDEFMAYDESVNVIGTYSVKDVLYLSQLEKEVISRGGEIHKISKIVFNNDDD